MTDTTTTEDLRTRALRAYEYQTQQEWRRLSAERNQRLAHILSALEAMGIPGASDAHINPASGNVCVPLIIGGIQTVQGDDGLDELVFTHTVAAEWDDDKSSARGPLLVADLEPDGSMLHGYLYPAGYLGGLSDLGHAAENGGRPVPAAPDAATTVQSRLSIARKLADASTDPLVLAADAICTALLDVAAAIRENGGRP